MNRLELLKKQLAAVEEELDRNRTTVRDDGWQTQRYARKTRNWDYFAQEKMRLIGLINDLEMESKKQCDRCEKDCNGSTYQCESCGTMIGDCCQADVDYNCCKSCARFEED